MSDKTTGRYPGPGGGSGYSIVSRGFNSDPDRSKTTVETRLAFKSELDAEIERRKRLEAVVAKLIARVADLEARANG